MLDYEANQTSKMWNSIQYCSIKSFYHEISKENIEYIKQLPDTLSLNFDGLKIKVVHGSPYRVSELVHFENEAQIEKIVKDLKEDILVFGHNHRETSFIKRDNKILLQDGVVGMHNNALNKATYAIIDYNKNKEINIMKRVVEYNKDELAENIRESEIFKNNRTWINLCYCNIKTGNNLRSDFLKEAAKMMDEKYKGEEQEKVDVNFKNIDDDIYMELSKKYEKYFLL